MKRRHVGKALAAVLLACTLTFGSAGVTVFAAEDVNETVIVPEKEGTDKEIDQKEVGNVKVEDDKGSATGVEAHGTSLSEGGSSVDVKGSVDVTETGTDDFNESHAGGVTAHSYTGDEDYQGESKPVKVSVSGDVNVTNSSDVANKETNGISAGSQGKGASSTVTTEGDITVTSSSGGGVATGIQSAGSYGGKSTASAGDDVTVTGDGGAVGVINAATRDGQSTVSIGGDLEVTSGKTGTDPLQDIPNDTTGIKVRGDGIPKMNINLDDYTRTIEREYPNTETKTTVQGNVTVKGETVTSVSASHEGKGLVEIAVGGDVTAKGSSGNNFGVQATTNESWADVERGQYSPNINITIGGNITSTTKAGDSWAVFADNNGGNINIRVGDGKEKRRVESSHNGIYSFGTPDIGGSNTILVDGDVTGKNGTGVFIVNDLQGNMSSVFTHDLLIDGTLKGSDVGVKLANDISAGDGQKVDFTVWKIEPNKNGNITEVSSDGKSAANFEKSIKYIIKLEQPKTGGTLTVTDANGKALEKSHGRDIAYEGDKVLMKVNLERGYKILAAYDDKGKKQPISMDNDGNYYVEVRKGGGVYLSVELGKEKYDVIFENDDGTELQSSKLEYGDMPSYRGKEPTKPRTDKYTYKFAGWAPTIDKVTGAITYKATYTATLNKYKLTFNLDGGTFNDQTGTITVDCSYDDVIKILGAPTREGYRFLYWKGSQYNPGDSFTVTGDHTFTAVWEKMDVPGEKQEIQEGDDDNKDSQKDKDSSGKDHSGSDSSSHAKAKSPKTGDAGSNGIPFFALGWMFLAASAAAGRKARSNA